MALRATDSVTLPLGCTGTAWCRVTRWKLTGSCDGAQPLCAARASQAHTSIAVACAQERSCEGQLLHSCGDSAISAVAEL